MQTYAGEALLTPTEDVRQWVAEHVPPTLEDLVPTEQRQGRFDPFTFKLAGPPGPPLIGALYWPSGASRFACGRFLASAEQTERIRKKVGTGPPETYRTGTFTFSDGVRKIETALYMLPARPLSDGLNLLTLVDERFFWWFKAADITVTENTTTWAQLYSSLAAGLGITLTVDEVNAAYLKPSGAFTTSKEPLPVLLDAAAYSVGQRIVRTLAGKVFAYNVSTSRTKQTENLLAHADAKAAGGLLALTP